MSGSCWSVICQADIIVICQANIIIVICQADIIVICQAVIVIVICQADINRQSRTSCWVKNWEMNTENLLLL